eukprot:5916451-Amphidinium_carterae.3
MGVPQRLCESAVADFVHTHSWWPLPILATWNARALCHGDHELAISKLRLCRQLLRHVDALAIQETHCAEDCTLTADDFGYDFHIFSSALNNRAGGLLLVARLAFLQQADHYEWDVILPGRIATLSLHRGAFCRTLVIVHLTPTAQHSWQQMCDMALAHMSQEHICILLGDTNVCHSLGDAVTVQTGQPKADFGARTYAWRAATSHLSDLPSGLTHVSKGVYTRIDRCCVNLPSALLASTDAGGQVIGDSSPPLLSDDWPVRFWFIRNDVPEHDGLPQWVLHHPDFTNLLELHKAMHGIRTNCGFSVGYQDLLTVVESATRELQARRANIPQEPHCMVPALLQYLHAAYSGDEHMMLSLTRRAPHWKLDVTMALADRITRASRLLEQARKDAADADSTADDLDSAQHRKTSWTQLAYSVWHKHAKAMDVNVAMHACVCPSIRDEALGCHLWGH